MHLFLLETNKTISNTHCFLTTEKIISRIMKYVSNFSYFFNYFITIVFQKQKELYSTTCYFSKRLLGKNNLKYLKYNYIFSKRKFEIVYTHMHKKNNIEHLLLFFFLAIRRLLRVKWTYFSAFILSALFLFYCPLFIR